MTKLVLGGGGCCSFGESCDSCGFGDGDDCSTGCGGCGGGCS